MSLPSKTKTVIIIVGPTASGKTDLSLELASCLDTSIISADSRQCYKELNIGVAKPPVNALKSIRHYFINSHSIHDPVNAQVFETYALQAAETIFCKSDFAVMVGGTGLYVKAFCEGLDEIPQIDASVRRAIIKSYQELGLVWLQTEIKEKDPAFWKQGEQQNPQRLMRALEVINGTGVSVLDFRSKKKIERSFTVIKVGIMLPKEELYENIEVRVDEMISTGLVEEVRSLEAFRNINALQTVGYMEMFDFLDGHASLPEAIANIKTNTRRYAKRQLTWFKKDTDIKWVCPDFSKKNVLKHILGLISIQH